MEQLSKQSTLQYFFLFINDGSGGGLGQKIMKLQVEHMSIKIEDIKSPVMLYFWAMRENREQGFKLLKKFSQEGKRTAAIVVGGDGTVMWVVGQFAAHNIDPMKVPIGIIPIGTGNDFSQELGWGVQQKKLIENHFFQLKKLIRQWITANQQPFDLWDIHAEVYQNGFFQKVDRANDKNVKLESKKLYKTFSNYFSFGMDGKIGYSFDRHRTESRMKNLMMYGILGAVKAMTKTKSIKQLVETMEIRQDLSDEIGVQQKIQLKDNLEEGSEFVTSFNKHHSSPDGPQIKSIISKSRESSNIILVNSKNKGKSKSEILTQELEKDYCNILALNINSFMGGVKDIWRYSNELEKSQQSTPSSTQDGKIQIVSFGSSFGLAAQRLFRGQSDKICQGKGPFHFKFKQYSGVSKHRTYFQCDGQFYRVTNPKSLLIKYSDLVPGGKIKVLRKSLI